MMLWFFLFSLALGASFFCGLRRATTWQQKGEILSSLPRAYGYSLMIRTSWAFLLIPFFLWLAGGYQYITSPHDCFFSLSASFLYGFFSFQKMKPSHKARIFVEKQIKAFLLTCTVLVIALAFGVVLSLIFEAIRFFKIVPLIDFLFGFQWDPFVSPEGMCLNFGALPLMTGTLLITTIAIVVAGPCGLLSAIYLCEYAPKRLRRILKPILEMLAGIPTVVYGFFAATIIAPWLNRIGYFLGIQVAMESALAAGLVMGVMILPFILSLCYDILGAIPRSLREGALALGSTPCESILQIVLPAAFPGIMASFLLAISRAIGETMLVVMAAGMTAHLTANPFRSVTTITVQIVTLLTGDQEPDSPKTLAAFALGLLLFTATLCLNIVALRIVRKYRNRVI